MKKYVITLSRVFPVTHARAGEPTGFKDKFLNAIGKAEGNWLKVHTIRANYDLWKKRFDEIDAGKACLCIRQWTGKPYCSKQVEIAVLTKEDGIGLQELRIDRIDAVEFVASWGFVDGRSMNNQKFFKELSHNDGLSFADWFVWFKGYDLSKSLAIIQLTKFRY